MAYFNQKGIAQIVLLIIILIGIAVTVWGVQYGRTVLKPKAAEFEARCPDNKCYYDSSAGWIHKHGGVWDEFKCEYAFDNISAETKDNDTAESVCKDRVAAIDDQRQAEGITPPSLSERICTPGAFNKEACSLCNDFGTGYNNPGANWGDKSRNPDTWCDCASRYSEKVPDPKKFNTKNFPECLNAPRGITCGIVGVPRNVGPISGEELSDDIVKLQWDAADDAQGYLVRVTQLSGGKFNPGVSYEADKNTPNSCFGLNASDPTPFVCIKKWDSTSMNIRVQPGAEYSWHVAGLDEDGKECRYAPATNFTTAPFGSQ